MNANRVILACALSLLLTGAQTDGATEPVLMRLNWQPGQILRYRLDVSSKASAAGGSANMRLSCEVTAHTRSIRSSTDKARNETDGNTTPAEPVFALGGRVMDVELRHGDLNLVMEVAGRTIEIGIGPDSIRGSLDGKPLPSYRIKEMARDLKPVQDILKSTIRLSMTDTGRVVEVAGLDRLDAGTQKELAMSFIEGMMLPEKPLVIGDSFIAKRDLESLLPKQPGQNANALKGRTVDLVVTLRSIGSRNGRTVAELTAPLQLQLPEVSIDDNGTRGSLKIDAVTKTCFDIDRGLPLEETVNGTILFYPKGKANWPSVITTRVEARITLIEPDAPFTTAVRHSGRN